MNGKSLYIGTAIVGLGMVGAVVFSVAPVSGGISSSPPAPVADVVVSGSVVAFPPDGGALVTFGEAVMPITCSQPDGGTCVLDVQGRGGGSLFVAQQGPVEVTGLAGARVGVEGPVTATISGTPAVTVSSGTVAISGTVSLSTSSLAAITAASAERVCTYGTPVVVAALTTTPSAQPSVAQAGRTEITLTNLETLATHELWCRVSGTPSSTNAIVIKAGITIKLNVTDTQAVNCMCSTSTCRINLQEAVCTHP